MFILFFLTWIFLLLSYTISSAAQVPVCSEVRQSGFITALYSNSPKDAIANFSFDLSVSYDSLNEPYPNTLTIKNFSEWYNDTSLYQRVSPWSFTFFENQDKQIVCSSMENCTLQFSNGIVEYFYKYAYQNSQEWGTYVNGPQVFVADGTFFNGEVSYYANLWDPKNLDCMNPETAYHVYLWANTCCIKFDYVEIPDSNNDVCQDFETVTKITDPSLSIPINLVAHYSVSSNNLQIDISLLTAPDSVYIYDFYPNYPTVAYNKGGSSSQNISLEMNLAQGNQYEFIFNYNPSEYRRSWSSNMKYQGIIVGEIINHNGVFLKNVNKPFTKNDPCWTKNSTVPFTNSTYQSSFCCTRFNTVTSQSTQILSTLPLTTTIQSTTIDPRSNAIGSSCSNDTRKAWLDIIFVFDTIRAGIITYASNVTVVYELKDVTDFNDFEKALLNLSAHPNDSRGKIQQALSHAYTVLTEQSSYRIKMIVHIAAAYDSEGLQDPVSSIIKEDGISIVVIHYVVDGNEDISSALQNISSPGYYYNTDRSEFSANLSYAFTQINCVCSSGWMQLQVYEKAWNNYTRYGDCYWSDGTSSNPSIANDFCDSGNLIALTSPQKLDFLTDNFTKTNPLFQRIKKFSIGLHKNSDLTWKWWGYNETEYPLGNYPVMSQIPSPNDNFGYISRYGFTWTLLTGNDNDFELPYICQRQACDAGFMCTRTEKL